MQGEPNSKAEIIRLLQGRLGESLEKIHQLILDLDEQDYADFLYPLDHSFAAELDGRTAEAKDLLANVWDIKGTLRILDLGKFKIQRIWPSGTVNIGPSDPPPQS